MKKLLILTFFAISALTLIATYGIFESEFSKENEIELAAWEVTINDTEVSSENKTFHIDNIVWNKDENVKEGKIAPGMDGYFDIVINPKNTQVSIRYDLTYDIEYLNSINTAFKIIEVKELNNNQLILTDENTYTGIIRINESNENIIRTYIKWEDLEENSELDYIVGTTDIKVEIPVSLNIEQYIGEEIIEYNSEE